VAVVLCVIVAFSGITWAANTDELKKKERELEELQAQMATLEEELDANQDLQSDTNKKIQSVSSNIRTLEGEISTLDGNIKETETAIEVKTQELGDAEVRIADKNDLLDKRLRVMYKTGSIGYLEVLFGAEDFTDLLSRVDMIQKILIHDQNLIIELKAQRDDIEAKKTDLENTKDDLVTLFTSKVDKQRDLNSALSSLVAYQSELKEDEAALNEMEDAMLEQANQVTEIIKNLKLAATYVGGEMMWPTPGNYTITSYFGNRLHPISKEYKMHTGIDIGVPTGTPVLAAQSGTIAYANWFSSYGKAIIIDHGGGYTTLYAHLDSINVTVGQEVEKGETIALSGSTGYSTGPHLHFEVRVNGDYVDPLEYVKGN
jgi:murein DD-endopeptidase MepM/ murein hydrolase activator NlpD